MLGFRGFISKIQQAGIYLLILLVGMLATGIDLGGNHSAEWNQHPADHSQYDSKLPLKHLVHQAAIKSPQDCKICFLHKLLSQSLFPAKCVAGVDYTTHWRSDIFHTSVALVKSDTAINRGPPLAG